MNFIKYFIDKDYHLIIIYVLLGIYIRIKKKNNI